MGTLTGRCCVILVGMRRGGRWEGSSICTHFQRPSSFYFLSLSLSHSHSYLAPSSMFVLLKGASKEEAFRIGKEIGDRVTALNPKPVKLKFEKVSMYIYACYTLDEGGEGGEGRGGRGVYTCL